MYLRRRGSFSHIRSMVSPCTIVWDNDEDMITKDYSLFVTCIHSRMTSGLVLEETSGLRFRRVAYLEMNDLVSAGDGEDVLTLCNFVIS